MFKSAENIWQPPFWMALFFSFTAKKANSGWTGSDYVEPPPAGGTGDLSETAPTTFRSRYRNFISEDVYRNWTVW